MKIVVIPIPNTVSEKEVIVATNAFFNEIGFATQMHVFSDDDAIPNKNSIKTSFMKAVDKTISTCGNPDDELAFKTMFRKAIINNGDPNYELLKILTSRISKAEAVYLAHHHCEWLPKFAEHMLNACNVMYGENL